MKSEEKLSPGSDMALRIDSVYKNYADFEAVKGVSLSIASGTILSLLGPSGCGKTTILRMIAGLVQPTRGTIRFDGQDVTAVPPHRRNIGMVFQHYALFPHMSVTDNVGFGLRMRGVSRNEAQSRIRHALDLVQMGAMANRYPAELSGGQQQRVSLARSIVTRPRLLLFDEPFGALDRKLREEMQLEVKQLQRELGGTFIFVTHDQEEALTLSDTIAVMRAGKVEQFGAPSTIYDRPQTAFIAEFFGNLNKIKATVTATDGAGTMVESAAGRWLVPGARAPVGDVLFAVRALDTVVATETAPGTHGARGTVEDFIYKGNTTICRVRLADGTLFTASADPEFMHGLTPDDEVTVNWPAKKAFLFPAE